MEKIYRIQKQITLNKKRIKNLLDINVKKRMTLKEIEIIAIGLNIDIAILFKGVL